MAEHHWN